MSLAGSIDDEAEKSQLLLRPNITKTFLKGAIAIGLFSIVLNISGNVVNYLIFLVLSFGLLSLFALVKHHSKFSVSLDRITIKRFLRAENVVLYTDIIDLSVAQGMLARRFDCGTVFMILKQGTGSVRIMGGGIAERLDDIPHPNYIQELITSKLSPFSPG
jgi:uncharacterized membrane protein YdbT with pleckstrin-like domain